MLPVPPAHALPAPAHRPPRLLPPRHIINNDDVITKAGKFWSLYKRAGHRVLVNKLGDLVVRPSYVETAIRGVPGGASVRDHLLTQVRCGWLGRGWGKEDRAGRHPRKHHAPAAPAGWRPPCVAEPCKVRLLLASAANHAEPPPPPPRLAARSTRRL
jgi:hypothetical protein